MSISRRKVVWFAASAVVLSVSIAPFALGAGGSTIIGGTRNPTGSGSPVFRHETQIIANNGTYGTRQSNKSSNGGGAIYGCRSGAGGSAKGMEPCIRAVNLAKGRAFEFATAGTEGGFIDVPGGDNAKPFTTTATGVATGLNADRVDSKTAAQITSDAATQAQAFNSFAQVTAAGTLGNQRGVTSAAVDPAGPGTYTVVFANDVSKCALTATETEFTGSNPGAVSVQLQSDNRTARVLTRDGGGADGTGPTALANHAFNVTAVC